MLSFKWPVATVILLTVALFFAAVAKAMTASVEQTIFNDLLQREVLQRAVQQNLDQKQGSVSNSQADNDCIHGYVSATDGSTCLCNYGWVGPTCAIDALPSCIRYPGLSCNEILSREGQYENQTCSCLSECVDYVLSVMPANFAPASIIESKYEGMRDAYKPWEKGVKVPVHPTLLSRCEDRSTPKLSEQVRLATPSEQQMRPSRILFNMTRYDYWAPFYFIELLLADEDVLVDDNASVFIMPFMISSGLSSEETLSTLTGDGYSHSPAWTRRPTVDDWFVVLSSGFMGSDKWSSPPMHEPPKSIYLQNNLAPYKSAKNHIAVPIFDTKFMLNLMTWRSMSPEDRAAILAKNKQQPTSPRVYSWTNNSLDADSDPRFSPDAKVLKLYFVGTTRIDNVTAPTEPPLECLDERLFSSNYTTCRCLTKYSECIRQYVYHNYRENPSMYLKDPEFDKMKPIIPQKDEILRGKVSRTAFRQELLTSRFCLVAGGNGFDMRIVTSIMSGCIPFWTFQQQVPPLHRVLRLNRIMFWMPEKQRPKIAQLEEMLDCYPKGVRAAMVANLEMSWPAFAWGSGTAYQHVLLEISVITGKRVPSAIKTILEIQGPKYVAEMLTIDLRQYEKEIPQLAVAIQLREALSTDDPLQRALEQVDKCIESL